MKRGASLTGRYRVRIFRPAFDQVRKLCHTTRDDFTSSQIKIFKAQRLLVIERFYTNPPKDAAKYAERLFLCIHSREKCDGICD